MTERIYLLDEEEQLVAMDEAPYDSEDLLQALLASHPDLLAVDGGGDSETPRWLLISREMGVPGEDGGAGRWSLDHLFVDQAGVPTLVEVKRSSDTRIRREVVGQLLDYAANAVVYWSIDKVRASFEASCEGNAAQVLAAHLQDEQDPEAFWQLVKTNLQAGRIRLVFVADVIPAELRRIIEFLNGQMDPAQVLGVEIRQFQGKGLKTLVPRVVGQTATAKARKGASSSERVEISEAEFNEAVRKELPDNEARVVAQLVTWAREAGYKLLFRQGALGAVCIPEIAHVNAALYPVSIRVSRGVIVMMKYLKRHPPFDTEAGRNELRERFERIEGFELRGGMEGMPRLPFAALTKEGAVQKLTDALDWAVMRVREGA